MRFILLILFGILYAGGFAQINYDLPLTRPFTLKNTEAEILEGEYHRQVQSNKNRSFAFPRPCKSLIDSSQVCVPIESKISFKNGEKSNELFMLFMGGTEYRNLDDNAGALNVGLNSIGKMGPLSFFLDTRMYVEFHEDFQHPSFDREFVERQDEEDSGSLAFSSYSRYRSNMSLNFSWARVTAARDALHWGPGQFENLVFHRNAIPFNHLKLEGKLGPFFISSVYGQLAIDGGASFRTTINTRSLYAHRYEWNVTHWFLIGISEQLILYENEDLFSFVPIVPLFIAKGNLPETSNNGNIAFDISINPLNNFHVYTEFLIDDIMSPTSLFDDFWGNKWAWMVGGHAVHEFSNFYSGIISEYSRIEPWVYTHYDLGTAQSANQLFPLGNQMGPNSQTMSSKIYLKKNQFWYFAVKIDLLWKGTDLGSYVHQIPTDSLRQEPKNFINGVSSPDIQYTQNARLKLFNRFYLEETIIWKDTFKILFGFQIWI